MRIQKTLRLHGFKAVVSKSCLNILRFLAVHAMPVSVITEIGESVDSRPSITVISHDLGLFWRAVSGR